MLGDHLLNALQIGSLILPANLELNKSGNELAQVQLINYKMGLLFLELTVCGGVWGICLKADQNSRSKTEQHFLTMQG